MRPQSLVQDGDKWSYINIIHLHFTVETAARKYTQLNSEKQIKQYSTKSCANEHFKSVKDDLYYLAHVAQMNVDIDTDYS